MAAVGARQRAVITFAHQRRLDPHQARFARRDRLPSGIDDVHGNALADEADGAGMAVDQRRIARGDAAGFG